MDRVVLYSLFSRSIREISANVRNIAHEIMVLAKIDTATHIAQIIGTSVLKSTIIGAMSVPKVQKRPSTKRISPAFARTASRKIYLGFGCGIALV